MYRQSITDMSLPETAACSPTEPTRQTAFVAPPPSGDANSGPMPPERWGDVDLGHKDCVRFKRLFD